MNNELIAVCLSNSFESWNAPVENALAKWGYAPMRIQPETGQQDQLSQNQYSAVLYIGSVADHLAEMLNEMCHAGNIWLIVLTPAATEFKVGPAVIYGQLACLRCYKEANSHLPFNGYVQSQQDVLEYDAAAHDSLLEQTVQHIHDFLQCNLTSVLRAGYNLSYDPASGGLLRQYRASKFSGCTLCSHWEYYPGEMYVSK